MIRATIEGRLQTLINLYRDLGQSFQRLAAINPERLVVVNVGPPPVFDKVSNVVGAANTGLAPIGLQKDCDDPLDSSRPGSGLGEVQRLTDVLNTQSKMPTLDQVLTDAIVQITASEEGSEGPPSSPGRSAIAGLFVQYFGDENQSDSDTLPVGACRRLLGELKQFIFDSLGELQELKQDESVRLNVGGIRGSVDNISAYPMLTSDIGGGWGGGPGGSAAVATAPNSVSLQRTVDLAIREVIGRVPKLKDTRSFLSALDHSFNIVELEGHTEYRWTPRSYAGQTDLGGGVTGGQASLYARAQVAVEKSLELLAGLTPLRVDYDKELSEAARSIVRSDVIELLAELGIEGGPRRARVDGLFGLLFTQKIEVKAITTDPSGVSPVVQKTVDGHLKYLEFELGLDRAHVNTLEEETNFTNFLALQDYLKSIKSGWEDFRENLLGNDLGTRFVLLARALSVANEAVDEVYAAMDSVFVGEAERMVASFHDRTGRSVLVSELLSWISSFTGTEAPRLIHEGGRRGVEAIVPTSTDLQVLTERFLEAIPFETSLPDGLRHPRVRNPLRELRGYLQRVRELAESVRRV